MEKNVIDRRVNVLVEEGIVFKTNAHVGKNLDANQLKADFDAVVLCGGATVKRYIPIPGAELEGVHQAMEFLKGKNQYVDGLVDFKEILSAKGKNVIVIGGGDTAMDCVRTAMRQGAESVKCLYRRDKVNMPGSQREVQNAEEEGVEFVWLSAPAGFEGDAVTGVNVQKMRLGAPDSTGRQMPELIEGADYVEDADIVIQALGFEPEDLPALWGVEGLEVTRWGTVKAEFTTGQTSLEGVYAAGDIVRGASLVVWAIKDGRDAAEAILGYLNQSAVVAAE
jgi:glutamate synthase (NADPH/NADH) small chain